MSADEFLSQYVENGDLHRLLLTAKRFPGLDIPALAAQIESLRKIRQKAPAWYRTDLTMPPALSVEQASSEAAARWKAGLIQARCVADLTGGMGVDAWAFAQHAETVHYVEQNEALAMTTSRNFAALGCRNIQVHATDAESFLSGFQGVFDLLYIDPARRDNRQNRVFRLEDCSPDITAILPQLLSKSPQILLKTAPLLDLKAACEQLRFHVSDIWITALNNEVKEALYRLVRSVTPYEKVRIHAVELSTGDALFDFNPETETQAFVAFTPPQSWIVEAPAAVLKAGAFKSFGARYGLNKLHPNTHLYTAEALPENIPGRRFALRAVCRYDRKAVAEAIPDGRAMIATRNFPDAPDTVRKKLALNDGGQTYIFAVTLIDERKAILICDAAPSPS